MKPMSEYPEDPGGEAIMAKSDYNASYDGSRKAREIYITQITDIERQLAKTGVYRGKLYNPQTKKMEKKELDGREARKLLKRLKYEKDELEGYAWSERTQPNGFLAFLAAITRGLKMILSPSYRAERKALAERANLLMPDDIPEETDINDEEDIDENTKQNIKKDITQNKTGHTTETYGKDGLPNEISFDSPEPKESDITEPKKETAREQNSQKDIPDNNVQEDRKAATEAKDRARYNEILSGAGTPQELMIQAVTENPHLVRFIGKDDMTKDIAAVAVEGFRKIAGTESPVSRISRAAGKNPSILKFYDDLHPGTFMQKAGTAANIIEKTPEAAEYLDLNDKVISFIRKDMEDPKRFSKLEKAFSAESLSPGLGKLAKELGVNKTEQKADIQDGPSIPAPEPEPEGPSIPTPEPEPDGPPIPADIDKLQQDEDFPLTPSIDEYNETILEYPKTPMHNDGLPDEISFDPPEPENTVGNSDPYSIEEKYPWAVNKDLIEAINNIEKTDADKINEICENMSPEEKSEIVKQFVITDNPEFIYDLPSDEVTEYAAAYAIANVKDEINIGLIGKNLDKDAVISKAIELIHDSGVEDYDEIASSIKKTVIWGHGFEDEVDRICNIWKEGDLGMAVEIPQFQSTDEGWDQKAAIADHPIQKGKQDGMEI